jgi:hypothetical protein
LRASLSIDDYKPLYSGCAFRLAWLASINTRNSSLPAGANDIEFIERNSDLPFPPAEKPAHVEDNALNLTAVAHNKAIDLTNVLIVRAVDTSAFKLVGREFGRFHSLASLAIDLRPKQAGSVLVSHRLCSIIGLG